MCRPAEFVLVDTGGLMSDAAQLPPEQRAAVAKALSDTGLPQVLQRAGMGPLCAWPTKPQDCIWLVRVPRPAGLRWQPFLQ